ncbi:hypothetical protein SM124_06660 [Bacillus sp. 31A1R]|uniref:ABC-2 type transporter transmembrane domain-containing protein n=1 Tax=Robertmurraya mangrovi TaxID=3098077 RepID=A0ABU5IWB8_9BACI|nr:ABC transporter permease [Bacillus sp. 31A1R]MDZ5471426.1 hypothetical protein [Bacillus sp. 31A1R]
MNIKVFELKKVFSAPIILTLMILFIGFNSFLMYEHSFVRKDLAIINKLIDRFGYQIDDKMETEFVQFYQDQLRKVNELTSEKFKTTFQDGTELTQYFNVNYEKINTFSELELNLISQLLITESYLGMIQGIDESYRKMDMLEVAETQIKMHRISGSAVETVRNQYKKLDVRFKEMIENEEHKNLFFLGTAYRMHSLLFKDLFRFILFELMILVVLMTGFIQNYEFENRTHHVTYSTKRGRKLIRDKFTVSILSSMIVTTIIVGTTLFLYFLVFDYSKVWNVPISSAFNTEYNKPYISWWDLSVLEYLLWSVVLIYICQILFVAMTFVITNFIKNSYIVFCMFMIVLGLSIMIPTIIEPNSSLIFIAHFTPFSLILNPFLWFMESGAFTTFKYYEYGTVMIWTVLLSILCFLVMKSFNRQSL